MKDTVYLVMNRRRIDRMLRGDRGIPTTKAGEVVLKLTLKTDDSNFRTPLAEATIEVGEDQIISNPVVEVEVETWEDWAEEE